MIQPADFDRCLTFINCQLSDAKRLQQRSDRVRAITISRQAGCGALVIAQKLAVLLQEHTPKELPPWTVFDRNLMERVLEDHHLPARLARFLPEDKRSEIEDTMDELFGVRPPSWTVVQQTSETILRLAKLGNVILIGRGSTVIAGKMPDVFHVRIVAPLENRIQHAREFYGLSAEAARNLCRQEDRGRKRYLRKYFSADIEDPLLYHMVLNTGLVPYDEAASLIHCAITRHSKPKMP